MIKRKLYLLDLFTVTSFFTSKLVAQTSLKEIDSLVMAAMETFKMAGGSFTSYNGTICKSKSPGDSVTDRIWQQGEGSKTAKINPQEYVSIYQHKWFGKVVVFSKGEELWFRCCCSPKLDGRM